MGFHKLRIPTIGLFFRQFKAWGEFHCLNPSRSKTQQSHLFRMWTLCGKMGLGIESKTRWQLKLHTSPMLMFLSFCRVNERICKLQSSVTSPRICKKYDDKKSHWTYLVWFQNLKTLFISHFCKF